MVPAPEPVDDQDDKRASRQPRRRRNGTIASVTAMPIRLRLKGGLFSTYPDIGEQPEQNDPIDEEVRNAVHEREEPNHHQGRPPVKPPTCQPLRATWSYVLSVVPVGAWSARIAGGSNGAIKTL